MKDKTEEIHVFQNQKQEDQWRKEWDYWRKIYLENRKEIQKKIYNKKLKGGTK